MLRSLNFEYFFQMLAWTFFLLGSLFLTALQLTCLTYLMRNCATVWLAGITGWQGTK